MQKARSGAIGQRLLGDQIVGKFVMKIGDQHAGSIIEMSRKGHASQPDPAIAFRKFGLFPAQLC